MAAASPLVDRTARSIGPARAGALWNSPSGPVRAVRGEAAEPARFRAGSLVAGRYVVMRWIARGGMGDVYEVFDQQLEERVALKCGLGAGEAGAFFRSHVYSEALCGLRVRHPNVCRVHRVGFCETAGEASPVRRPLPFLIMDLVNGTTLSQRLTRGFLSMGQIRALAQDLLEGLGAIHAAGMLHGDFKSQNVLLQRAWPSARERAVIVDFGLAQRLGDPPLRADEPLAGSPAYMSPEQLARSPLCEASDLFAFGVVLFEMLTGGLPPGRTVPALGSATRFPPSGLRRGLPRAWDGFVMACLELDPRARFPTARAALHALSQLPDRDGD